MVPKHIWRRVWRSLASLWKPSQGEIIFTSLGLVVLDEIRFGSAKTVYDVLGGSGTYATLGARLFSSSAESRAVGLIILAGCDFPSSVETTLQRWNIALTIQRVPDKKSTRGLLQYWDSTFGHKRFEYTTPPMPATPDNLKSSGLLGSRAFHFLSASQTLEPQIKRLIELRNAEGLGRPVIVWEPAPPFCRRENFQICIQTARLVDVFSPNHLEFAAFFEDKPSPFDKAHVGSLVSRFMSEVTGDNAGIVVIRAGEHGCLVCAPGVPQTWIPPYYSPQDASKIVDTTGAGNAFLGAFTYAYLKTEDVITAAHYGTVAASFMVEQISVPDLLVADDGSESWSGAVVQDRLKHFQSRMATPGLGQDQQLNY